MRAFIIRPFGTKNDINFDEVEAKLIDPALNQLAVTGRTTMEIRRQGNIRLDMFQRLLTADLVIADISIHNANVYYELGVRHALRGKRTFMIHAQGTGVKTDEAPFDIKTDRYLAYDANNPAASLADLIEGLRQTINSEEQDSPIFQMLPDLAEQDRAHFLPIPRDFREEVERARQGRERGDLELLAAEARGFEWEIEGLRVVGRAQFNLKAFEGARTTWEAVRKLDPLDVEANTMLGTIYQRLCDLTSSDQALQRVLTRKGLDKEGRAEVQSLLGRNAKTRWTNDWKSAGSLEARQRQALTSPYLDESLEAYQNAFKEDLNHFYSGVNTLALLTIQTKLAELLPDVWAERFEEESEAERELAVRKKEVEKVCASADLSLKAAAERLEREQLHDMWAEISQADLCFLTSKKPTKVSDAYRRALVEAPAFANDAVRRQLSLYQELGLFSENVVAVLRVLPADSGPLSSAPSIAKRALLFTGHMIDAPDRETPRFPPDKVEIARQKIAEAVAAEQQISGGISCGVAGCASGGDMLFHQVCEAMGIPTRIFLALPRDLYIRESVAPAGPQWVEEFNRLVRSRPVRVLGDSSELPRWLQEKPNYNIWQRNNLWNLHNALAAVGGENVTLIALWNGTNGDGPGGTGDMVQKARERGAKIVILDSNKIFAP
ncbi:MAG TPA: tetratricopeptide repeat-containing protein [Pyrinomonadaceae bacterium]|jgi:tetratricopeptide (TPR) repeat protein|nr:tetratricopeptide repeat-containing protein [Pyrinomonadaceae bacterium]